MYDESEQNCLTHLFMMKNDTENRYFLTLTRQSVPMIKFASPAPPDCTASNKIIVERCGNAVRIPLWCDRTLEPFFNGQEIQDF